ncbi:MAG: hypothetical protein K1060chlam2_00637 [Chlamydiae bacterium]|nr:hypothetical protein [Chlamydiota bacterium]
MATVADLKGIIHDHTYKLIEKQFGNDLSELQNGVLYHERMGYYLVRLGIPDELAGEGKSITKVFFLVYSKSQTRVIKFWREDEEPKANRTWIGGEKRPISSLYSILKSDRCGSDVQAPILSFDLARCIRKNPSLKNIPISLLGLSAEESSRLTLNDEEHSPFIMAEYDSPPQGIEELKIDSDTLLSGTERAVPTSIKIVGFFLGLALAGGLFGMYKTVQYFRAPRKIGV